MLFEDSDYAEAEIPVNFCIAEIPDFQGMIHKSYAIGKPVFILTDSEIRDSFDDKRNLTVGNLFDNYVKMRDKYREDFEKIARQIITIGNHENSQEPVFA